jgi:GNAT superfamily N-acetyltransferase
MEYKDEYMEYRDEHVDSHGGQQNWELGLYRGDDIIGMVQYVLYDGELTVSDIVVLPSERRKGYGSRMMKHIKKLHPEYTYTQSMKTDLGSKFKHKEVRLEIRKVLHEMLLQEYETEYYDEDEVDYDEEEYYDDESPEQYYTTKISDDIKRHSHKYAGQNIIWYGDPDQMIVVRADQVEGMWGNIYDPEKQRYLAKLLRDYPEKIEIECSYGTGAVVNIRDIQEEQNAVAEDRFESDYDGKTRASSTGSKELDYYVGHEIEDMDFAGAISPEVNEFFENHKLDVVSERYTPEQLQEGFNSLNPDENEVEAFAEFIQFEIALKSAKDNGDGDFGKFIVQLRDGHHRVMGAIDAGEDYVCLNLEKDDIIRFEGHYHKV